MSEHRAVSGHNSITLGGAPVMYQRMIEHFPARSAYPVFATQGNLPNWSWRLRSKLSRRFRLNFSLRPTP